MDDEKLVEAARAPALALAAATCKHVGSPCRSCIVDAHVGLTNLLRTGYIISPPGSVVLPPEGTEEWEKAVERIARVLCRRSGSDPDRLEPGDIVVQPGWHEDQSDWDETLPPDGHKRNGDPAHFMWRQHIFDAQAALRSAGGRGD